MVAIQSGLGSIKMAHNFAVLTPYEIFGADLSDVWMENKNWHKSDENLPNECNLYNKKVNNNVLSAEQTAFCFAAEAVARGWINCSSIDRWCAINLRQVGTDWRRHTRRLIDSK